MGFADMKTLEKLAAGQKGTNILFLFFWLQDYFNLVCHTGRIIKFFTNVYFKTIAPYHTWK